MTVTFFGHRNAPKDIECELLKTIEALISQGADKFYVGNNGNFDYMVRMTLKNLKESHPHIAYFMVLAYLPNERDKFTDYSISIYPEGLENVPPRFAIDRRNRWMVRSSDTVVTYVNRGYGGAAKFKEYAEKSGKHVINLG